MINIFDIAPRGRYEGSQLVDRHNSRDRSRLPFNGSAADDRGFVRDVRARLEDGSTRRVLQMHPKWVGNGTIKGWLPWTRLPDDAVFEAEVGFLDGARGTDGVSFQVWAHRMADGRERWTRVGRVNKAFDGRLASIRADLHHLSGERVQIELRVDAGRSSGRDWAAWVEPRVVSSSDPGSMAVTIEMKTFTVLDDDEDDFWSNGDEPYLLAMNIFADGTTIDATAIQRAGVRILSPSRTHDNLTSRSLRARRTIAIPESTGLVETTMRPVGGLDPSLGRQLALAGLAVIVLEEDATPTSAIRAGRRVMIRETRNELNSLIRSLRQPTPAAIASLSDRVKDKVLDAIKKEVLGSVPGIFTIVDPDDYIGSAFSQFTYADIQDAGADGIPFDFEFRSGGARYALGGLVKNA